MIDVAIRSVRGFVTGKLFQQPLRSYGLLAVGVGVTVAIFVGAIKLRLPAPAAAAIAAFLGGVLQPRLFKDLKYR